METEPKAPPPPEVDRTEGAPPAPEKTPAAVLVERVEGAPPPAVAEKAATAPAVELTEDAPPVEEKALAAPAVELTEDAPPVEEKALAAPAVELTEDAPAVEENAPAARPVERAEAPPAPQKPAEPAPAKAAKPPRKRWWLRALLVVVSVIVAAAVALIVFGPGLLRARIEDEARQRGIVIAFADVTFSFERIVLLNVQVKLDGVPDFTAAAERVEVDIEDWEPRAVRAARLEIDLFGTDVVSSLGTWKTAHPAALAMPINGGQSRVQWHPSRGMDAAVTIDQAVVGITPDRGFIEGQASVAGRDAGPMKVDWVSPPDGFVVQIRPTAPPLSAVHAEILSAKGESRIKLTLERTALAPLAAALGVPKGSEGLVAEGEAEMPLPSFEHPAPLAGSMRLSVKGYIPPHPRDLDGIVFGDTTLLRSKFLLAEDYSGAKLSSVAVEAGALALSGSGDVVREGFDARVTLKLKGTIACTALASSAAVARLGRGLGGIAGALAAGALKGSVSVSLTVDARASDIKGAKIKQSASIGCKVSIPGLPEIILR